MIKYLIPFVFNHQEIVSWVDTSLQWIKDHQGHEHQTDPTAFVYSIPNDQLKAKLFPVQNGGHRAIQQYNGGYLSFGYLGEAFFIHENFYDDEVADHVELYVPNITCKEYNLPAVFE